MKQKRKTQPDNLKRYWIGFSLLAIFLLIPFRIVSYWMLTNIIYGVISLIIGIGLVRFIWCFGWKRWIVILMMVCLALPILQINLITLFNHQKCYFGEENTLIQSASCNDTWLCSTNFATVGNTLYGVQTTLPSNCFSWYIP